MDSIRSRTPIKKNNAKAIHVDTCETLLYKSLPKIKLKDKAKRLVTTKTKVVFKATEDL